jgi:hypothetical protein
MIFNKEVHNYLIGNKFSNGLKINFLPKKENNITRIDYLKQIAVDNNILHLGCADHLPLIEDKIKKNQWLHKILIEKAKFCVGIDSNKAAIDFITDKLNIPNVLYLDIIKDELPYIISSKHWDYLILGEILEHIDNPVNFLYTICSKFKDLADYLIITVPNAFELTNFLFSLKSIEFINSDHRYWFTPFTLAKISTIAGFEVNEFHFSQTFPHNKFWKRYLTNNYPFFRETLIIKLSFHE